MHYLILTLFLLCSVACSSCKTGFVPYDVRMPSVSEDVSVFFPGDRLGWGEESATVAAIRLNVEFQTDITDRQFTRALTAALHQNPSAIFVAIDSYGGDVATTNHIMRQLLDQDLPVVCLVKNLAASSAYILLQTCDVRFVEPGAYLMMHEAKVYPKDSMEEIPPNEASRALNDGISYIACFRLEISHEECYGQYTGRDWWINAEDALALGAIDGIYPESAVLNMLRFRSDSLKSQKENLQK